MSTLNYFSLLSDDIIRRIWQVCDNETRFFIVENRLFASIVREELKQIVVQTNDNEVFADGTLAINELRDTGKIKPILQLYGDSINYLELRFSSYAKKFELLPLLAEHCTQLNSMLLTLDEWDENTSEFLEHVGPKLQLLEVESYDSSATEAAAMHIASLCTNLKKFRFTGRGVVFLGPVWISSGNALEQIGLRGRFESGAEWAITLTLLGSYCKELKSILLNGSGLSGVQAAELLLQYGGRLEEAMISCIAPDLAVDIGNACTNLRRCVVIEKDEKFRTMLGMGAVLTELFLYIPFDCDYRRLERASAMCPKLNKLVIECYDENKYIPHMFSSPKRQLEILEMDCEVYRKQDLDLIANATGSLRRLTIEASKVENNEQLFDEIALKNPGIKSVSVTFFKEGLTFREAMTDKLHVDFAFSLANAFSNCLELRTIELSNRSLTAPFADCSGEQIRRSFIKYRLRGVRIFVYGTPL